MVENEELKNKAKKSARSKTLFYFHLACYLVVNIGLIVYWWPKTDLMGLIAINSGTLFGWGIGVIAHFIGVFSSSSDK